MSPEAMRELETLALVCPELNMANYTEDDVRHLNDWAIEMSLLVERHTLSQQPATPEPVAKAWADGYRQGIEDERTSEANIGVAGFGAKVNPSRENPYGTTRPAPGVPDDVVRDAERYRWLLCNYLKFHLPDEAWKHGSLDAAIDAAMLAAKEGGAA